MARRRWLRALGPALLMSIGGAYALASYNWCGRWPDSPPQPVARAIGDGPLLAGAAKVQIQPPYPVVRAGYGPPRSEPSTTELPLHARAVVFESGSLRVAVVTLEVLLVPAPVASAVRGAAAKLGVDEVWVAATHSHSSMGGYDARLVSQLAGTGRFRQDAQSALIQAGSEAIAEASRRMKPVRLEVAEGTLGGGIVSRAHGVEPDPRVQSLRVLADEGPVAELALVAAHPTLEARQGEALSPDYPGWLSAAGEEGGAVRLVLMGAVGNSRPVAEAPEAFASTVSAALEKLPAAAAADRLAFARVNVALPRPDASRLVPGVVRRAGANFLCTSAPRTVDVSAISLGGIRWVAIPGEVTTSASAAFEPGPATRVVSLVNDYIGYVEAREVVEAGRGEAKRQYFSPELTPKLSEAARVALETLPR